MTPTLWLPIKYRDFYDFPRMFVVQNLGATFLFDCPFDEAADDFSRNYVVYRLASESGGGIDASKDWSHLPASGVRVGTVRVMDVRFDEIRREYVDGHVLDQIR